MTNEQKNQIAELRQSGYGYANIAGALGLTKNQVSAYCRRNGLTGTKAAVGATDAGRKPVKFCSSACRVSWWNAHPDAVGKKAFYDYTCACCGKTFRAYGNSHRKYCCHTCYIQARFKGGDAHD